MDQLHNLKLQNPINTAQDWALINPILLKNEIAFDSDTMQFKIGDGTTAWNDLPYSNVDNSLIAGRGIIITPSTGNTFTVNTQLRYSEVV